MMDKKTKKQLEHDGWTIGSAIEFAGLIPADEKLFKKLAAKPPRPEVSEAAKSVRKRFRKTLDRLKRPDGQS